VRVAAEHERAAAMLNAFLATIDSILFLGQIWVAVFVFSGRAASKGWLEPAMYIFLGLLISIGAMVLISTTRKTARFHRSLVWPSVAMVGGWGLLLLLASVAV
jgi:hypothetical protein